MTIVKVIKALYVKLGGSLTDTYSGIAGGAPVSNYSVISDCIKALYAFYGGDLTEVYPAISDVAVKDYASISKTIAALAKVAFKGIVPTGKKTITENGTNIDVAQYATADVNVPQPTGKITITENGTDVDIAEYATADVAVETYEVDFINTVKRTGNSVTIPNGVTQIGKYAFACWNGLESVTIPPSVTTIKEYAFYQCFSLGSIVIPTGITLISQNTFDTCSAMTEILLPSTITAIQNNAFKDCSQLADVYFTGTQAEWENINKFSGNDVLTTATIHYEYTPE